MVSKNILKGKLEFRSVVFWLTVILFMCFFSDQPFASQSTRCNQIKKMIISGEGFEELEGVLKCYRSGDKFAFSYLQSVYILRGIDFGIDYVDQTQGLPAESYLKSYFILSSGIEEQYPDVNRFSLLKTSFEHGNEFAAAIASYSALHRKGDLADLIAMQGYKIGPGHGFSVERAHQLLSGGCDAVLFPLQDVWIDRYKIFYSENPEYVQLLSSLRNSNCDVPAFDFDYVDVNFVDSISEFFVTNFSVYFDKMSHDSSLKDYYSYSEGYNLQNVNKYIDEFKDGYLGVAGTPFRWCKEEFKGDDQYRCARYAFYDDFNCISVLNIGGFQKIRSSEDYKFCRKSSIDSWAVSFGQEQ